MTNYKHAFIMMQCKVIQFLDSISLLLWIKFLCKVKLLTIFDKAVYVMPQVLWSIHLWTLRVKVFLGYAHLSLVIITTKTIIYLINYAFCTLITGQKIHLFQHSIHHSLLKVGSLRFVMSFFKSYFASNIFHNSILHKVI